MRKRAATKRDLLKSRRPQSAPAAKTGTPAKAISLVMRLMGIPGPSGEERRVAQFVTRRLLAAGAQCDQVTTDRAHQKSPAAGQVGNLIFKLPGTRRGRRRLLMAHLDTVPLCVGARPVRRGNLVHSADADTALGADNRAGCAVLLHTAMEILRRGLDHPPLTFLWTVQEETGLQGVRHVQLSKLGRPALAFNWDGGAADKLTVGATGGYRMTIDVQGIASHAGGAPEQGVSAIAVASLAVADLQQGGWHGDIHHDGRHGTSNVGVIRGGAATNVVADRVHLKAEARSHDPAFRRRIVREIEAAFRRAADRVKNAGGRTGRVKIDGRLDYDSFLLNPDEPCIVEAEAAIRAAGGEPMRAVTNGGLDANWMTAHGIPTVTTGAGQLNQHMTSEQLDVDQFGLACRVALHLATRCGR